MTVRDVDKGYQALVRRVYGIRSPHIKIGIFEADGARVYEDATTVLEVAMWNEFGTATIPERSFIRAWFDENESKCREAVRRITQAVLQGKYTPEQALELLGQRFVAEMQKRIAAGIPPPNAPSTIRQKGGNRNANGQFKSSKPLIDTGQLRSSITHKVERR